MFLFIFENSLTFQIIKIWEGFKKFMEKTELKNNVDFPLAF